MSSTQSPGMSTLYGSESRRRTTVNVSATPGDHQAATSSNPSTAGGPVRRSKRIKAQPVDEHRYKRVRMQLIDDRSEPAPLLIPLPAKPGETSFRDYYHKLVKRRYPNVQVTDDFHLYWLAHGGPDKKPFRTLEESIKRSGRMLMGSVAYKTLEDACQAIKEVQMGTLHSRATVIGDKPDVDDVDDVHYAPVPDSDLDIRIWGNSPGLNREHIYCLDFVVRATREPVNAPRDCEIWVVPPLSAPWLPSGSGRLTSMEHSFGKAPEDIRPGQEKFCVMEGSSFQLRQAGKPAVSYNVPIRPSSHRFSQVDGPVVLSFTPASAMVV